MNIADHPVLYRMSEEQSQANCSEKMDEMDEMNMDDMSDVDEECKINETMYEE